MSAEVSQKQRVHPNSLMNLRLFQPGQSGNPGGYPKGTPKVSVAYAKLLALSPAELEAFAPSNVAEVAALKQVIATLDGKIPALKSLPSLIEITDRTEGKARQAVDVNVAPMEDRARVEAAIMRVIQTTACDRQIAESAVLAQPEFRQLAAAADDTE